MECEFEIPKTYTGEAPSTSTDFWQYSKVICATNPSETELIKNEQTGAEFFIRKSISYGDFLIITFLMIFLVFGITKFLFDFLIPKFINLRK